MNSTRNVDLVTVKQSASLRWREVLQHVGGIPGEVLDGKNHPCPKCGGTDRFRLIDARVGAVFCNQCFSSGNGDGIAAIQWSTGLTFRDSLTSIAKYCGLANNASGNGQSKTKPKASAYATAEHAIAAQESHLGPRTADWTYHNADGESLGMVLRWDKPDGTKEFRPLQKVDGWRVGAMPSPRPLYRQPELAETDFVCICEGEKAADTARSIGFVATTSVGGSNAADKSDWSSLAGKEVVILPDHDDAGEKYAAAVMSQLQRLTSVPTIRVVRIDKLIDGEPMPKGGDLVDWIDGHGDSAEPSLLAANLRKLIESAAVEEVPVVDLPLRWQPFPVDLLPEPLSLFVISVARSIQVDPAMVVLPALCTVAAAIGASRSILLRPDWIEPCILWGALVAASGEGKTPAASKVISARKRDAEAQEINREREAEYDEKRREWELDHKTWEKQRAGKKKTEDIGPAPIEPTKPRLPRFTVGDVTVERLKEILADSPRGLLMIRDELAAMLGGFDRYTGGRGGSERSTYLSFHNAEPDQNDRKVDNRRNVTLKNPHLSIYGGIQPELLHRVVSDDDLASGLAARFLFAMPPAQLKTWKTPAIPPQYIDAIAAMFRDIYAIGETENWSPDIEQNDSAGLQHLSLPLTTKASELFGEFYETHHSQRSDLHGPARAAWPKLVAYCGRLSLVMQMIYDPDSKAVDDDSVQQAIQLTKWFANESLRIYALRTESDDDRDNRELVALIEGKGGTITVRELSRGPRQYRQSGVAELALNQLVEAGLGNWKVQSGATNKKRVFTLTVAVTATDSLATAKINESVTVTTVTT